MDKKGVSRFVVIAVIILVTLVAFGFIWSGLAPVLKKSEVNSSKLVSVTTSGGHTFYDPSQKIMSLQIKQGADSKVKKVKIIIDFKKESHSEIVDAPGANKSKIYYFDLSHYSEGPSFVSVVPVFGKGYGGDFSKIFIPKGKIIKRPSNIGVFGECRDGDRKFCGIDTGICVKGVITCKDGKWGVCKGAVHAKTEVCGNGLDDDCDGKVDEGCGECSPGSTRQCGTDVGVCEFGTQTCGSDKKWGICQGAIGPTVEICGNNKDDDCDGKVDEGCGECSPGSTRQCGTDVGVCEFGTQTCGSNEKWGACEGGVTPTDEDCGNGLDDDCDGKVDLDDDDCVAPPV